MDKRPGGKSPSSVAAITEQDSSFKLWTVSHSFLWLCGEACCFFSVGTEMGCTVCLRDKWLHNQLLILKQHFSLSMVKAGRLVIEIEVKRTDTWFTLALTYDTNQTWFYLDHKEITGWLDCYFKNCLILCTSLVFLLEQKAVWLVVTVFTSSIQPLIAEGHFSLSLCLSFNFKSQRAS